MNIINSKYSAKELNEVYEKEMTKIDKKARARAERFDMTFYASGFCLFLSLWVCVFLLPLVLKKFKNGVDVTTEACWPFVFFVLANFITMAILLPISKKAQSFLYKHYRKQGKILESPFEGHWHNIRFVEQGEKLQALMSSEPKMEVLYNEHGSFGEKSFILLEKDPLTGMFVETEEIRIGSLVKAEDWDKFMLPDGTLDFSIYDKSIEEVLSQIEKGE